MTFTVAQAKTELLEHLDDDGTRWSDTAQSAALSWALASCQRMYVGGGNSRFNIEGSFTSDTNGLIDLSTINPVAIRGLTLQIGNRHFPLSEILPEQRNLPDSGVARVCVIRYAKPFVLSSTGSDPLVAYAAGVAAPSWDSFDHWVVLKAASLAMVKDGSVRQEVMTLESMAKDAVMLDPQITHSMRFPGQPVWYSGWFTWYWRPDLQKIQICKRI